MRRGTKQKIQALVVLAGLLVAVHAINNLTGGILYPMGLLPRSLPSLPHVFTAPFLHASWHHLANNLLGLILFGSLCLLRSVRYFLSASLFIIVVSGVLVWLFGRANYHIGASGWVFGLWALCIAAAVFERNLANFAIAAFVVFFYGGMIYGVLPGDKSISFEYHLFGAIAGILYAALGRKMPALRR